MRDFSIEEFAPNMGDRILSETVAPRKVYYRLSESEIFKTANSKTTISGDKLIDAIPKMLSEGNGFAHVGLENFDKELVYDLFESNRYRLACRDRIRELIKTGKIVLAYSDTIKVPTSIPFVVRGMDKDAQIYVNISDFVTMDQYGIVKITQVRNYNGIMALLFAAAVAQRIVSFNPRLNSSSLDGLVLMYGTMMEKVVNSICHLDPTAREKVKYLATEFALVQMYGTENGTGMFERIKQKYFPGISKIVADAIDSSFRLDNFDNVELFIDELKRVFPAMKNLSLATIFGKWIKMYGPSTALSIDYLGYHIYTFSMLIFESPLVSRMALESTINQTLGANTYKDLQSFVKGGTD